MESSSPPTSPRLIRRTSLRLSQSWSSRHLEYSSPTFDSTETVNGSAASTVQSISAAPNDGEEEYVEVAFFPLLKAPSEDRSVDQASSRSLLIDSRPAPLGERQRSSSIRVLTPSSKVTEIIDAGHAHFDVTDIWDDVP